MPSGPETPVARPRMKRWLAHAAAAVAIIILAGNALAWLHPDLAHYPARGMTALGDHPVMLTLDARLASLVVSTLHLGILAWALLTVRALFLRFADGKVLEVGTGRLLGRLGLALVVFAVATPVVRTLVTLLVTMHNPPGQKALAIGFSANELIIGLVGGLIVMTGEAMREAAVIADEHRQIV